MKFTILSFLALASFLDHVVVLGQPNATDDMMMDATMGPTDGLMDDGMMDSGNMTEPAPGSQVTANDAGVETNPPQSLGFSDFTCAAGGTPTNTDQCAQYIGEISVTCECYYFCSGGSLVRCLEAGVTEGFGCSGGDVIQCFENPAESAAFDDTKETLSALYYTAATALAALLCVV